MLSINQYYAFFIIFCTTQELLTIFLNIFVNLYIQNNLFKFLYYKISTNFVADFIKYFLNLQFLVHSSIYYLFCLFL